MCGIAGFTRFGTEEGSRQTLVDMGDAIAHRGPDAEGTFIDTGVGLCHRRLSIIDLSEAGNQPMASSDGRYVLVFNGEIYNFQTLRRSLEGEGVQFHSASDTEVILALFQRDGLDCLRQLNGMFAFALWDSQTHTLTLARDRLGKKPLYYYHAGDTLVFGSELKAVLRHPAVPRRLRYDALHDFFAYQYVPDPKTIFENIHKLKPAHWLQISPAGVTGGRYWQLSWAEGPARPETEIVGELGDLIRDATATRMISDVPLGAFLSGGIDSSGIVALMAGQSSRPVTTCSIGFNNAAFNETEFARQVALQYGTDHHEFTVGPGVADRLESIARYFDEPFADPSLVPTYAVSELARRKVTVALAGDGGDELFAGYEKYAVDHTENRLRRWVPGAAGQRALHGLSGSLRRLPWRQARRAGSLLNSLSLEPDRAFYLTNSHLDDRLWALLINDDTRRQLGDYHPSNLTTERYHEVDSNDHLARLLHTDMTTYLPGNILVKADRMSMANSLEVRAPLLDYRVAEYAATLPSRLKFNGREKKYILKQTFTGLLPDDILYRKKMGFSVPLAEWLRHDLKALAEQKLLHASGGIADLFNTEVIARLWQQHLSERFDHSSLLWNLLMFQLWWDAYMTDIEQPRPERSREAIPTS